jgi:hypothetical protein
VRNEEEENEYLELIAKRRLMRKTTNKEKK